MPPIESLDDLDPRPQLPGRPASRRAVLGGFLSRGPLRRALGHVLRRPGIFSITDHQHIAGRATLIDPYTYRLYPKDYRRFGPAGGDEFILKADYRATMEVKYNPPFGLFQTYRSTVDPSHAVEDYRYLSTDEGEFAEYFSKVGPQAFIDVIQVSPRTAATTTAVVKKKTYR